MTEFKPGTPVPSPTASLVRHSDQGCVCLSDARHRACLEAAWEIEALARLLPRVLGQVADTDMALQMRGLGARMAALAGVLMSGLDDEMAPDGVLGAAVGSEATRFAAPATLP